MQRLFLFFLSASIVSFSSVGLADSVILDAIADNTIYQDNPSNSNGSGDFFFAGNNGGNSSRRSLIRFDLSSIPENAVITNVTFTAFVAQGNPTVVDISLHRLQADWGESNSDAPGGEGGGAPAEAGDATWDENFFGTSSWNNPGADFDPVASATTSVGGSGDFYNWTSAALIADLENWRDGTNSNFGWILIGDESAASTAKSFSSRTNASNSPQLTVEFTSIPEPGLPFVIVASCIAGTLQRRRND